MKFLFFGVILIYAAVNVRKVKDELDRKRIFAGVFGGSFGSRKELKEIKREI